MASNRLLWPGLQDSAEWINRPSQPPGLARSGVMEMAVTMVEARRRKQAGVPLRQPEMASA